MTNQNNIIISEVVKLLQGGSAHAGLSAALEGLPPDQRGQRPNGLPYSIWQLVEHIRIALWDMLEFSKGSNYESPKWPDEYWPKQPQPAGDAEWESTINQINQHIEEMVGLVKYEDIYKPLPHGDGQTVLREALQAADHTAYHVAEIIVIRRLLGSWKS